MNRGRVLATSACIVAIVLACAPPAAAAPKGKSGKGAAKGPTLDGALAELRREYAAHQKDADAAPLRDACDYFVDHPLEVPPAALFGALVQPNGKEPRLAAYVKWQLLGALPATLDDAQVQRLIKVYQKAPFPAPRYASTKPEQQKLDRLMLRARPQDDVELTSKLEEAVKRAAEADRPVLAYREELYRRLPLGRDKIVAGLRDGYERMSVAVPTITFTDAVRDDMRSWVASGEASRAELREVAELMGKLRFLESPPYYESAGVRKNRLGWVLKTGKLMPNAKMVEMHKLLLDAAGMPATSDGDGEGTGGGRNDAKKSTGKDKKKTGTDS